MQALSLFFTKLAGALPQKALAQVFFCEICEIFKNTVFHRTPLVTALGGAKTVNSNKTEKTDEVIAEYQKVESLWKVLSP